MIFVPLSLDPGRDEEYAESKSGRFELQDELQNEDREWIMHRMRAQRKTNKETEPIEMEIMKKNDRHKKEDPLFTKYITPIDIRLCCPLQDFFAQEVLIRPWPRRYLSFRGL